MTRRGKCRCGTILHFQMTSQGYKTRCPSCTAVVRLRMEPSVAKPKKTPSPVLTGPPPLPPSSATEQTDFATDGLPHDESLDLTVFCEEEPTAPPALPDMEAYSEPEEKPTSWVTWLLFALLAAGVVGGVGVAAMWW